MKYFEHFNESTNCPICGKNNDGKAVLIPIVGEIKENVAECKQVHLDCLDLYWQNYKPKEYIIYQYVEGEVE